MMELNITDLNAEFVQRQQGLAASAPRRARRATPLLIDYDYLVLDGIYASLRLLLTDTPQVVEGGGRALDAGSADSPYHGLLRERGYRVETLDIRPDVGSRHVGSIESSGLPSDAFDLILCTQVLEHVRDPSVALGELKRILKPGGYLLVSIPHVWPYHPCPDDFWRFTQQGVVERVAGAGFKVCRLVASGGTVATCMQLFNIVLYGAVRRLGAPVFVLVNLLGKGLDRCIRSDLLCMNWSCLAQKPQV